MARSVGRFRRSDALRRDSSTALTRFVRGVAGECDAFPRACSGTSRIRRCARRARWSSSHAVGEQYCLVTSCVIIMHVFCPALYGSPSPSPARGARVIARSRLTLVDSSTFGSIAARVQTDALLLPPRFPPTLSWRGSSAPDRDLHIQSFAPAATVWKKTPWSDRES